MKLEKSLDMGDKMNTILFDLDGTLLPMDNDLFHKIYFKSLLESVTEIPAEVLMEKFHTGLKAMILNDGTMTNRERFAETFGLVDGKDFYAWESTFEHFYANGFTNCVKACEVSDKSRKLIDMLQAKGYKIAIATNPMFPKVATYGRLSWMGLEPSEFSLVTTFEEDRFAKPNPKYYQDVIDRIGSKAEDCIMVGNDVADDGGAMLLGIPLILLNDCLLDKENSYGIEPKYMSYAEFVAWCETLPNID